MHHIFFGFVWYGNYTRTIFKIVVIYKGLPASVNLLVQSI